MGVLVFVDIRVNPKDMSIDELWDIWEEEAKAALEAIEAGKVVSLYKVCGQRRAVGVFDVESHDELDQILMAGLPLAHYLEIKEVLPVREYEAFASDVMQRWEQQTA
jgi:muconolactone delta-isomerase